MKGQPSDWTAQSIENLKSLSVVHDELVPQKTTPFMFDSLLLSITELKRAMLIYLSQ